MLQLKVEEPVGGYYEEIVRYQKFTKTQKWVELTASVSWCCFKVLL
jgi:hypothetical protein